MKQPLVAFLLALTCALLAAPVFAQTRAWLDRDRIGIDETVALNLETDDAGAPPPDYGPLLQDFIVSANSSSRQFDIVNGVTRTRVLYSVALQPRRQGLLAIPALAVGNHRTQPLTLTVSGSQAAPTHAGDPAFIEAEADAQSPYVQQAVGYTVRLYYATQLVSGELDQDAPDGATLQRVGDDLQYERAVGGRQYHVVERRFLLIPERSGTLAIPGARFAGRGVGSMFDDMFGDADRDLRAASPPRILSVQPIPADAPQPWLPLRALTLRYSGTPQQARAGEAATVTVEADADGASAAQLPELQLQAGAGAQVFADPPQADERFLEGRPHVHVTRRFSIVPAREGALRIAGPSLAWWDVRAGVSRTATLPDIQLHVAPGAGGFAPPVVPAPTASPVAAPRTTIHVPGVQGALQPWALVAVAFALLWLLTLGWALHRRAPSAAASRNGSPPREPAHAPTSRRLGDALAHGDLGDVADALCALAGVADLDAVRTALVDAPQQAAVDALQRARWGDGDGTAARELLRRAFRSGPRWRVAPTRVHDVLPPLYPPA